jgi:biopolymer transport protein ExbD
MAKKKKIDVGVKEFNMTPMIDVTFQLIIFFILVGQIASEELAALIPPEPVKSLAAESLTEYNVIVNVASEAGDDPRAEPFKAHSAEKWFVRGEALDVSDDEALTEELQKWLLTVPVEEQANACIEIRSDKRVFYQDVEYVLLAAGKAGIQKMNITALVEKD